MISLRSTWLQVLALWTACAMVLMMLAVPGKIVAAQVDEDTYEFSSGQVLEWSGAWEIDPETSGMEAGLELVLLTQTLSFMAVMSVPAGLDVDSTRDAFLEGFLGAGDDSVTIDRGAYGAVSYSLDTIRYDDVTMGAFTLFRSSDGGGETFAWIFVSFIDTFASQFSVAQGSFTLDGNPPFTGIDGQGLQDQLATAVAAGNVPEDDDSSASTREVTVTLEATATEGESSGGGGLKGGGDASTAEPNDPTVETDDSIAEEDDPAASGDVGLLNDSTYVSPAYGTTVEWDANFVLNADRDPNPSAQTNGIESVSLTSSAEGTPVFVAVHLSSATVSAKDYAVAWSTADFLAENANSPEAEVLLVEGSDEVAGVVYIDFLDDGTELIFYYEFRVDTASSTLTMLEYYTIAELVEETLPLAQDGVLIDNDEALNFFSVTEVLEAARL